MGKYFGTDGFRGEANATLTPKHAYAVGRFLGWHYGARIGKSARILIGKDTRRSGYMLEYALCAGVVSSGADAYILHVITTPGVAYVTRTEGFDMGVMISASHNPFYDNGIKLIGKDGEKPDDGDTSLIEHYIDSYLSGVDELPSAIREKLGKVVDFVAGRNRYVGYLISLASHSPGELKIGLDCSNGAAWHIAPSVFGALGAKTHVINDAPDGTNINRLCGSTHIDELRRLVCDNGLDVGFAYDGDADRCIAVDERGQVVDGDGIIYIFAKMMKEGGGLDGGRVVLTKMSNLGLMSALDKIGVAYELTDVGDRFVYERMKSGGYMLGGEQSGHVILRKYASTGDGILTSVLLCEQMIEKKCALSKLSSPLEKFPQVTVNVPVCDKDAAAHDESLFLAAQNVRNTLGDSGRLLIRKSGTEPLIRVMVECKNADKCAEYAEAVASTIRGRY